MGAICGGGPGIRRRASRHLLLVVAVIALVFVLAGGASSATMLLKNKSFEKPVVPSGSFQLFSTGSTFAHWSVVGAAGNVAVVSGSFTQNGFSFPARAGAQWLDLTGISNSATGVAQTVPTTPGANYALAFWIGNVVDPSGAFGVSSTVNVLVNGIQMFTATNSGGAGMTTQVWKKFTTTFTATSASTTIEFDNGDPSNDTHNGLDAVKMTLIP